MASSSSISGLVSGLDTTTLVSKLMTLEAAPQKRLQTQLASITSQTTAVRSVNTKAASISTAADALTKDALYATTKVSSSSASATATVTGTPAPGTVSFSVTSLASASSIATSALPAASGSTDPKTFTITKGGTRPDAATTRISAASDSPADIAAAINASAAGVTASVITDSNKAQRLVLTSTTTGKASALSLDGLGTTQSELAPATDAQVSLGAGFTVTSATNTFTNLVSGASIAVNAVTATGGSPVTITTAKDASGVTSAVTGLVASMNSVLSDVAFHTKQLATGVTASSTNGGLLAGNNTLRTLSNQILDAVSGSVGTAAASRAGLAVTRTGEITFDQTKLDALTAADPAAAKAVLVAFGTAMKSIGDKASNATTGSLTGLVTGNESTSKTLTSRIADWDVRLDLRESSLNKKYSALEVALGKLQSQSESLAQTLESLTSSSNS